MSYKQMCVFKKVIKSFKPSFLLYPQNPKTLKTLKILITLITLKTLKTIKTLIT